MPILDIILHCLIMLIKIFDTTALNVEAVKCIVQTVLSQKISTKKKHFIESRMGNNILNCIHNFAFWILLLYNTVHAWQDHKCIIYLDSL